MRLFMILPALIVSASFVASAQKPAPPAPVKTSGTAVRTIDITATDDMKFSVTTINAKPGEQLRIRLTVKGVIPKIAMAHNVVVLRAGTDALKFVNDGAPHRATDFIAPALQAAVVARTPLAGPGETVQTTFTVPAKPGRYPFVCTFSGHYQAGARGMLIVR